MWLKFSLFVFSLFIATFLLGIYSCKDKNCPNVLIYHLPVSVTPQSDTFNIGDSLRLYIDIPKELIDAQGGIKNTFENFDFKLFISSARYDTPHNYSSRIFNLHRVIGSDTLLGFSSSDEYALSLHYDGIDYSYEGNLVLKESGVFAIYLATYYGLFTDPLKITGNCDHLNVHFYCNTNEGMENNVELVKPYFVGNPDNWDNDFKKSGGFAFVVR